MTNLVDAFHNNDIVKFESILKKHERQILIDDFIQEYIADLLRTIRKQVLLKVVKPYTRISLLALSKELNEIPVKDVEGLLVPLILDGRLEGRIDQVSGVLVKTVNVGNSGAGSGGASSSGVGQGGGGGGGHGHHVQGSGHGNTSGSGPAGGDMLGGSGLCGNVAELGHDSIGMQTIEAIEHLIDELENLTSSVVSSTARGPDKMQAKMMEGLRA